MWTTRCQWGAQDRAAGETGQYHPEGGGTYQIVFRYRSHAEHQAWTDSEQRHRLVANIDKLLYVSTAAEVRTVDGNRPRGGQGVLSGTSSASRSCWIPTSSSPSSAEVTAASW